MLKLPIRFAKRLAVFIPGVIIAVISFKYTLPFFDKRLPDAIAILFTYGLAAYVLIPGLIRLWRIVWPAYHLPLYCVTPDGFASDPLNVGVVGTRLNLIEAMEEAGWSKADPHTVSTMTKQFLSIVFRMDYPNGPASALFLFGRKQDLTFINGSGHHRHHVRFWSTTFTGDEPSSIHNVDWRHRKAQEQNTAMLWVGAASLDNGIMPIRHTMQLTHMVHPDTNVEREFVYNSLDSKGLVEKTSKLRLGNPYKLVNRTWRGELHTDGKMRVVWLKPRHLN
jgi:hypothetical protein